MRESPQVNNTEEVTQNQSLAQDTGSVHLEKSNISCKRKRADYMRQYRKKHKATPSEKQKKAACMRQYIEDLTKMKK